MTRHPSFISTNREILSYTTLQGLMQRRWVVIKEVPCDDYCWARHLTQAQYCDLSDLVVEFKYPPGREHIITR